MSAYSVRCRECGYSPIGPYIDNCPICAAPVRGDADGGGGGTAWQGVSGTAVVGWIVIGCLAFWLFGRQWAWAVLAAGPAGVAWWFLVHPESQRLTRWLAGAYLALLVAAGVVASQPQLLPGLDPPINNPEELIEEMMHLVSGGSTRQAQIARRFKTLQLAVLAVYPGVVVPPFLLVPPLLRRRYRRVALLDIDRRLCVLGLVLWAGLLAAYASLALPEQMRVWLGPGRQRLMLPQFPPQQPPGDDGG
jgi:hypothetical protein